MTPKYVLSVSGETSIKVWDAKSPEHPLVHEFKGAHGLGIHHIAVNREGSVAASVGFEGGLKIWDLNELKKLSSIGEEIYVLA